MPEPFKYHTVRNKELVDSIRYAVEDEFHKCEVARLEDKRYAFVPTSLLLTLNHSLPDTPLKWSWISLGRAAKITPRLMLVIDCAALLPAERHPDDPRHFVRDNPIFTPHQAVIAVRVVVDFAFSVLDLPRAEWLPDYEAEHKALCRALRERIYDQDAADAAAIERWVYWAYGKAREHERAQQSWLAWLPGVVNETRWRFSSAGIATVRANR